MSLGSDLSTIRKEKNLSLEDIFEVTKIPVHTLKSIENDTLLKSSTEHKTYLRSFIRSYAKALKILDAHIIEALKATEAESYDNDLIKLVNPEAYSEEYSIKKEKVEVEAPEATKTLESKADTYKEEIESNEDLPTSSKKEEKTSGSKPTVDTVNWADMSKKVYASPTNSKVGLILILVLLLGGLITAGYFYGGNLIGMFSSAQTTEEPSSTDNSDDLSANSDIIPADSTLIDDSQNTTLDNTPAPSENFLPETLTVTLYAAYDKLERVRVTSDFNNRTNPFWMEQGEAYYFDFRDSLVIRGQYSRLLLMFNGNVINNPRQNHFDPDLDSIVLTREILNSPQYLQNSQGSFPANLGVSAPDSIIYRIQF